MSVDGGTAQMVLEEAVLRLQALFELLYLAVFVLERRGLDLFLLCDLLERSDLLLVPGLFADLVVVQATEPVDLGLQLADSLTRVLLALARRVHLARQLSYPRLVLLQLFAQVSLFVVVVSAARVGGVRA